jgi:hypothetical protein
MLSAGLFTAVATVSVGARLLGKVVEVMSEVVALIVVRGTVLFDVPVAALAGAHAASTRMLIVITRLKMFLRFISFLHL